MNYDISHNYSFPCKELAVEAHSGGDGTDLTLASRSLQPSIFDRLMWCSQDLCVQILSTRSKNKINYPDCDFELAIVAPDR